jgi:hypothetical protein
MAEVQIEEMFRSDRNRSRDYQTSRGRQCRAKEANKTTRRSARRSVVKNSLTGPTLLEMFGNATYQGLARRMAGKAEEHIKIRTTSY